MPTTNSNWNYKPKFQEESNFVKIEKIIIKDIPCLLFKPKDKKENHHTIIYYHGWSSNKDFQKFKGTVLASFGFQVIIPDSIYHGDRNPINHNLDGMLEKYFKKTILNSIEESSIIIDYALENLNVESNKIGIMGHSMGGFISSGAFIKNKNLKALVVINGSCAWSKLEEKVDKYKDENNTSDVTKELMKYDPYHNYKDLEHRPVLLVHGEKDDTVPIYSQEVFYEKILNYYKDHKKKLSFLKIPDMTHSVNTTMLENCIHWFKRYLSYN